MERCSRDSKVIHNHCGQMHLIEAREDDMYDFCNSWVSYSRIIIVEAHANAQKSLQKDFNTEDLFEFARLRRLWNDLLRELGRCCSIGDEWASQVD